ncbi:hypothetical protein [Chryseobacterium wangxinyae]|uniref:hypothetical protein n=1 Tax=unclassified Chryseobacterium TaxID=2593645 RepID=UPI0022701251|nr:MULTISPECIES: hypothetical protein [unclassified Chryseobacterium]MCY0967731.1 hypothetical protein [Chryseobacterium sp. CY353]MCY0978085.1 hypothetical protein [Chryseobacterium sp. CY350]WBZ95172.1 hypothetical protein PGH12_17140 [Chryseobacterium sp. CY350]
MNTYNKIFKNILLVGVLVSMIGCSPTVNYIGKNYNPTQNIDVFLDTNDVKKNYEVIGKVDGISGVLGSSYQEIQDKVVQTAKEKGADAVILYNMEQRIIGSTSSSNTVEHRQWMKNTTTESTNVTEDVLHADFIKYIP